MTQQSNSCEKDMFYLDWPIERMSDHAMPRDIQGTVDIDPHNGPHGYRPVYLLGRQVDDAKVWTSAMFITFQD